MLAVFVRLMDRDPHFQYQQEKDCGKETFSQEENREPAAMAGYKLPSRKYPAETAKLLPFTFFLR